MRQVSPVVFSEESQSISLRVDSRIDGGRGLVAEYGGCTAGCTPPRIYEHHSIGNRGVALRMLGRGNLASDVKHTNLKLYALGK
jgi:hypothetical protein